MRDKASEERLHLKLATFFLFVFWIASYRVQKMSSSKNSHLSLDLFSCFLMEERKNWKESWRHTEKLRNTETQREKLPIKTAQITEAPSDTLADKKEPSAKPIPVLFLQHAFWLGKIRESQSLPKNKADRRGSKTFKMFNSIKILSARQLVCPMSQSLNTI